MAAASLKLCKRILQEFFGDIVAEVGEVLLTNGTNPLKFICNSVNLPLKKVKESLCVLIKHNLVVWEEWKTNIPGYTLLSDRVLLFIRYPRYVSLIRDSYGEEAEMIIDVILKEGQVTASQAIILACLKLLEASEEGTYTHTNTEERHIVLRNAFSRLVKGKFIQRCPAAKDESSFIPDLKIKEEDLYNFSADLLDLRNLQDEIKQRRATQEQNGFPQKAEAILKHPDVGVYWRINYDVFHLEFRDIELRNGLSRRIDPLAGACLQAMLKVSYTRSDPWSPMLDPITVADVRNQKDIPHLEQYMKIIEESGGGCVCKVGDAGGGEYRIDIANGIRTIALSIVENVVQERYGSKAARIFRLVCENGMIEQEQLAELSMIGKKEANLLMYRLFHDNFIRIHEIRKGLLPSPVNKGTFLFLVDIDSVVRMILAWCEQAVFNLMEQREMRYSHHKRTLERKSRVDSIVENLRQSGGTEEQIQEVEEMVTTGEKEQIENVLGVQDKLFDCETNLDESIFILQLFIDYRSKK